MIQFNRIRIILDKFASYEYHAYKRKIYLNTRIKHLDQMEGAL